MESGLLPLAESLACIRMSNCEVRMNRDFLSCLSMLTDLFMSHVDLHFEGGGEGARLDLSGLDGSLRKLAIFFPSPLEAGVFTALAYESCLRGLHNLEELKLHRSCRALCDPGLSVTQFCHLKNLLLGARFLPALNLGRDMPQLETLEVAYYSSINAVSPELCLFPRLKSFCARVNDILPSQVVLGRAMPVVEALVIDTRELGRSVPTAFSQVMPHCESLTIVCPREMLAVDDLEVT